MRRLPLRRREVLFWLFEKIPTAPPSIDSFLVVWGALAGVASLAPRVTHLNDLLGQKWLKLAGPSSNFLMMDWNESSIFSGRNG
jgi:hypothetical protein